jgi:hypothetical protein
MVFPYPSDSATARGRLHIILTGFPVGSHRPSLPRLHDRPHYPNNRNACATIDFVASADAMFAS